MGEHRQLRTAKVVAFRPHPSLLASSQLSSERGGPMIHDADVVVIGSGGLGAASSFYLSKRGVRRVALVDKHDIGSQTSPRAAGL